MYKLLYKTQVLTMNFENLKERPAIKSQEKKEQKEKEKMAREGHHEKARRERAGRRA